jgi:phosphoserine aminotransferase
MPFRRQRKVKALSKDDQAKFLKGISSELSKRGLAHDINSYKDAPPGYRFWCGPTIEEASIKNALEELEKVYNEKIKTL